LILEVRHRLTSKAMEDIMIKDLGLSPCGLFGLFKHRERTAISSSGRTQLIFGIAYVVLISLGALSLLLHLLDLLNAFDHFIGVWVHRALPDLDSDV
jgi:hypothetical protein